MQLVAYGAQDIYLTGQPQITFFKSVYRRHTNFAMESIQQSIQGTPDLSAVLTRCEVTVNRNGDLILGAHIQLDTVSGGSADQKQWSYENLMLFDHVELDIGGQLVDRIYGDWMVLYAELVYRKGYDVTDVATAGDGFGSDVLGTTLNNTKSVLGGGSIYVPLLFYFNNNPGLALPLISLQYHEVRFILFINTLNMLASQTAILTPATTTGAVVQMNNSLGGGLDPGTDGGGVRTSIRNMRFFVDYAYLDTAERRKFAQNAHEYLITQHQRINIASSTNANVNVNLSSLNHPIKYLAWRFWEGGSAPNDVLECLTYSTAKITLNGSDRMTFRPSSYYENKQVEQFWPCGGNQLTYTTNGETAGAAAGKWSLYSFALRPAEHQPSGTCNFSRIDISQLEVTTPTGSTDQFTLHAENYNVLRIMSGMGGLAYSN